VIEGLAMGLILVIVVQIWERSRLQGFHSKEMLDMSQRYTEEQATWSKERQQLLDRIQASTFAEYKHQEVKVIKAKSGVQDVVIETL
jgi:hypothetical protein